MSGLDTYLRQLPGRCQVCTYHVASQGHGEDCAPVAPADEWATFTTALRTAARDGVVHQGDVRPLIRGRIKPHSIGRCYSKAIDQGLLTEITREKSDDVIGRNTNKWEPVYQFREAS